MKTNQKHLAAIMKSEEFSIHLAAKQADLSADEREIFAARFHGAAKAGKSFVEASAIAEVTASMYREHAQEVIKSSAPVESKEDRLAQIKSNLTASAPTESFSEMMARIRREQG